MKSINSVNMVNVARTANTVATLVLVMMFGHERALALVPPATSPTPSLDRRADVAGAPQVTVGQQRAALELQSRIPRVRVDFDKITGAPGWISTLGFLTATTEEEIQRTGGLGLAADDPHRAIKAFLIENAALFGHGPEMLTNAAITRDFVAKHAGLRTIWIAHAAPERHNVAASSAARPRDDL